MFIFFNMSKKKNNLGVHRDRPKWNTEGHQ
jgi:hypothetical protein